MTKMVSFQIKCGIWFLIVALGLYGCGHRGEVDDMLNIADSLMEIHPDSALMVLDDIDEELLKSDRLRARFALLKSMALDKNYIDTTNFDVLQPAVDYYLKKGTSDEKQKTFYYQSVIYRNSNEDDLAMQALLSAQDIKGGFSDSLTLARIYVAQGALYYKQYRTSDFVFNNLTAADIYRRLDFISKQLQCYGKAILGEIILRNKNAADSILNICDSILNRNPNLSDVVMNQRIQFMVEFGCARDIEDGIIDILNSEIPENMISILAKAYSRIGDTEKALFYIDKAEIASDDILDSLTYWSVKTEILENLGKDKDALDAFRNYSRLLEVYHDRLFSNELLFSEKKHQMQIENMAKIKQRDDIIKWIFGGMLVLVCIIGFVYYRYRMNRAGRLLAESNAERLQLQGEKQRLMAEKLEEESARLKLETENLHLQIGFLEDEKDRLSGLLDKQETLSTEARKVIIKRIEMLNGLFAQALTDQESYGKEFKQYVNKIKKDKKRFQESIEKVLEGTHPEFMAYLRAQGLSEREIGYVCLYAIGLRGKEIGNYLDLVRHYNISADIRRKLGLETNGKNLGTVISDLMQRN